MIIRSNHEVVSFIKDIPTIELKAQFLVSFREWYSFEFLTWEEFVEYFIGDNWEELTELGYLVED